MAGEVWLEHWEATHPMVFNETTGQVYGPLAAPGETYCGMVPVLDTLAIVGRIGAFEAGLGTQRAGSRARLAAAAPRMLRLWLINEFCGEARGCGSCAYCLLGEKAHDAGCPIDELLTEQGFPTAESRDAARAAIDKAGL